MERAFTGQLLDLLQIRKVLKRQIGLQDGGIARDAVHGKVVQTLLEIVQIGSIQHKFHIFSHSLCFFVL